LEKTENILASMTLKYFQKTIFKEEKNVFKESKIIFMGTNFEYLRRKFRIFKEKFFEYLSASKILISDI
jgi:hypothetical protein